MQIVNKEGVKQKIYRRTERRAEPAFSEILAKAQNNNTIRCRYCNNVFYGITRKDALQHLDNHIRRKHSERVEAIRKKASVISLPREAVTPA